MIISSVQCVRKKIAPTFKQTNVTFDPCKFVGCVCNKVYIHTKKEIQLQKQVENKSEYIKKQITKLSESY